MKIDSIGETVEGTITALQTEGFKIANTAHMMEILSKRLYSNPELAVCRELVCNAIDAHKAVNNPNPVEVYLPEWTNDFRFVVKDNGTGLSEEDVMNLYTTYGASTKQSSNDFIGCLGIGSKSPFAVTEEFTVVSRYQGKATTYHCYKQKGLPVCTKLSEVPTDEHNGMTITVPFTKDNFNSFNNYCYDFFRGVNKDVVEVHSSEPIEYFEEYAKGINYKSEKLNYAMYTRESFYDNNFVRMGQVIYKIPMQWARDSVAVSNYSSILDVPIGTFTIAASRENIEENEANKQKYLSIVSLLRDEFYSKSLKPALKNAKTFHTFMKFSQYSSKLFDYRDEIRLHFEHNSKMSIDKSVGYCKAWYAERGKTRLKVSNDVYISRDNEINTAIVQDEKPVVTLGILINRWTNISSKPVKESKEYVLLPENHKQRLSSKFIAAHSMPVVYVSQLNQWYEYTEKQRKRRIKTSKKRVKSEAFTMYRFYNNYENRRMFRSSDVVEDFEVPYVVLKELKCVDQEDEVRIQDMYRYQRDCYGIALTNAKHLPVNFIPLKDYMEAHKQEFIDKTYRDERKRAITFLKRCKNEKHWYVDSSTKNLLGKDQWLRALKYDITMYKPQTYSDRLLQDLLDKYKRYKKFLTVVSSWFNIYRYDEAPEEIKSYIKKLYEEMVVSSASTTN